MYGFSEQKKKKVQFPQNNDENSERNGSDDPYSINFGHTNLIEHQQKKSIIPSDSLNSLMDGFTRAPIEEKVSSRFHH